MIQDEELSKGVTNLPFIKASHIIMTSGSDRSANAPRCVIHNVRCLWDTGAQTSCILASSLLAEVRGDKEEGTATMEIECDSLYHS